MRISSSISASCLSELCIRGSRIFRLVLDKIIASHKLLPFQSDNYPVFQRFRSSDLFDFLLLAMAWVSYPYVCLLEMLWTYCFEPRRVVIGLVSRILMSCLMRTCVTLFVRLICVSEIQAGCGIMSVLD